MMSFSRRIIVVFCLALIYAGSAAAQNAQLAGLVTDPSHAVVSKATVEVRNDRTGVEHNTQTNSSGSYFFNALAPGSYSISTTAQGFSKHVIERVTLSVGALATQDVRLALGTRDETITVSTGATEINTSDATVSTVVDRNFVDSMPLNGRSFQSLLTLVPGVAIVASQGSGLSGEVTVNGQRTEANAYQVDGVSANTGANPATPGTGAGFGGGTPGQTVLGMTQSLISVDALQEFRAVTSTYSAQYGRTPGGQFTFSSRGGTNLLTGSVYDYFRNDVLDANNWFSNYTGTPKPAERQNNFGGTLGGPIVIPHVFNGHDKAFFFGSYEGFRLAIPQPGIVSDVPTLATRATAAVALRPFLNAYPLPTANAVDQGNGLATISKAYSYPATSDTGSLRLDYSLSDRHKIFARYSYAPSFSQARSTYSLSNAVQAYGRVQTATVGLTSVLSSRLSNELHANFTENRQRRSNVLDTFGGATPFSTASLAGYQPNDMGWLNFYIYIGTRFPYVSISPTSNRQRQVNVVDTLSYLSGRHLIQTGVDFRRLETLQQYPSLYQFAQFYTQAQLVTNTPTSLTLQRYQGRVHPVYKQLGLYIQDEWRVSNRFTLSTGVRWDLSGAPSDADGNLPYTLDQVTDPTTAKLAPAGTPLWHTQYTNFAPRLGIAYQLNRDAGYQTVLRAGAGIYYDTGNTQGTRGYYGAGRITGASFAGTAFPLSQRQIDSVVPGNTAAPYSFAVFPFDPNLKAPRTVQWNIAIEQGLGSRQTLTVNYVASAGRQLTTMRSFLPGRLGNSNFKTYGYYLTTNGSIASYNSLQVKFQRQLASGLQALVTHTWSHSIDDASSNFQVNKRLRSDSDFDIRNNFQAGLVYRLPSLRRSTLLNAVLREWNLDARVSARSAQTLDLIGASNYDPITSTYINFQPNYDSSKPLYIYDNSPGGRRINYAAFTNAAAGVQGNTSRNFARGFSAVQADLAVQRSFHLTDRFSLQPRLETFNVLNRANFGNIYNQLSNGAALFGRAYNTQNTALGGLNSLYQTGGPRSMQIALRIGF
jgi:hypothetical protein